MTNYSDEKLQYLIRIWTEARDAEISAKKRKWDIEVSIFQYLKENIKECGETVFNGITIKTGYKSIWNQDSLKNLDFELSNYQNSPILKKYSINYPVFQKIRNSDYDLFRRIAAMRTFEIKKPYFWKQGDKPKKLKFPIRKLGLQNWGQAHILNNSDFSEDDD